MSYSGRSSSTPRAVKIHLNIFLQNSNLHYMTTKTLTGEWEKTYDIIKLSQRHDIITIKRGEVVFCDIFVLTQNH
jgi:hypothetical protein